MKHVILTIICLLSMQMLLQGQVDYDKYPKVASSYFLQDVYIMSQGKAQMTNIHLNNGFIEQIGTSLKRPKGSILLSVDSMYVYPAFIDVLSHYGIKKKEEEKYDIKFPGMPPDAAAGITPDASAQQMILSGTPDFSKLRDNGFAISQIANKVGMLPGSTFIALLSEEKSKMVFTEKSNQFGQFESASGMYPATIIGIMAKFRDLYRNAELLTKSKDAYSKASASSTQMPTSTEAINALVPLTQKKQTMFFYPGKKLNAMRAIQLKKELGFQMSFVGIDDISGLEDMILKENIPLALTIGLPKELKEEKKDSTDVEMTVEQKSLTERRMKAYDQRMGLASYLEDKSVPFAFSLGNDTGSDLKKNLVRLVKSGLSEKAAMDAMTINAAKMLGIEKLAGSVTKGKLANLLITDAPYFDEKSNIRMMVVGSETFEYEVKTKEDKPADESLQIEGVWDFSLDTPGGKETGTIKIEKEGENYTVYTTSSDEPDDPEINKDVALSGNEIEYGFEMTQDGYTMPLSFVLKFKDSETMEGSVSLGDFGAFPIAGNKVSSPE